MRINREGRGSIAVAAVFAAVLTVTGGMLFTWWVAVPATLLVLGVMAFFRDPKRELKQEDGVVFAPCDGRVVLVERVVEDEYFGGRECVQVSIFMSLTNVHANYFPVAGEVSYYKYHAGKYLVAWHPKSSKLNEHTTTVVRTPRGEVMMRQIAGFIARRIVCYAKVGSEVRQNSRLGFIKFGSRMDILMPPDSEVLVKVGECVKGSQTVIARL